MLKREKNHAIRVKLMGLLKRHGAMTLHDLAAKSGELRQVVQGNLGVMRAAGEVANVADTVYVQTAKKTAPLKAKALGRTVNVAGSKLAIAGQCADSKAPGPRQSTQGRAFGLL